MAWLVVLVLLTVSVLHVYWALGGRWGADVAVPVRSPGGMPVFQPRPAGTLLVAVSLLAGAWLVLARTLILPAPLPEGWVRLATAVMGAVFLVRAVGDFRFVGLFRRVRGTSFARWDSWLFTPMCLALGTAILMLVR